MYKIFVSTYPYGKYDTTPRDILKATGWNISYNPYERKLKPEELAEFAFDSDGIIAGTESLSPLLQKSTKLKHISRVGIGLDSVPLHLCRERGIRVSYTPDAVTMGVAELTIGLMIDISRYISNSDREVRNKIWTRRVGKRIGHSTIGIIGIGRVGQNVIRLLSSFKPAEVLVNDIKDRSLFIEEMKSKFNMNIRETNKEEIYSISDIISLHVPSYNKTSKMIDSRILNLLKKDAFLINTARGELVDEDALFEILSGKRIAGAALDVFKEEPYKGKLISLENILLTQHMGSCSYDCRLSMETQSAEECIRFFREEPLLSEVPDEEYLYQND